MPLFPRDEGFKVTQLDVSPPDPSDVMSHLERHASGFRLVSSIPSRSGFPLFIWAKVDRPAPTPTTFADIVKTRVFRGGSGSLYRKRNDRQAVCLEDDSLGDLVNFTPGTPVSAVEP